MKALVDNDVLLKAACYRLLPGLVEPYLDAALPAIGVLAAARFVLPKRIRRTVLRAGPEEAIRNLETFLSMVGSLEPTDSEQALAAELELAAQKKAIPLDSGESQLCAILITRNIGRLLTGDKRAIAAMEQLMDSVAALRMITGRVKCLEQIVKEGLKTLPGLRASICSERDVDKSLSVCFSCTREDANVEPIIEGLTSYIEDVRKAASRVLATEIVSL